MPGKLYLLEEVAAGSGLWDIVCQLLFWTPKKKKSLLVFIHGCHDIYLDLRIWSCFPSKAFSEELVLLQDCCLMGVGH